MMMYDDYDMSSCIDKSDLLASTEVIHSNDFYSYQ